MIDLLFYFIVAVGFWVVFSNIKDLEKSIKLLDGDSE